jgi:hypothetical protein
MLILYQQSFYIWSNFWLKENTKNEDAYTLE